LGAKELKLLHPGRAASGARRAGDYVAGLRSTENRGDLPAQKTKENQPFLSLLVLSAY